MTIKDFKKAILDNYHDSKERKLDDYYSDEIKEGLDEILNYAGDTEIDDDIKTEITDDRTELSELADSMVDPYTSELLKWYQADLKRCGYADDFIEEFGNDNNFIQILSGGQYMYYSELLNCVKDLIKKELEQI